MALSLAIPLFWEVSFLALVWLGLFMSLGAGVDVTGACAGGIGAEVSTEAVVATGAPGCPVELGLVAPLAGAGC